VLTETWLKAEDRYLHVGEIIEDLPDERAEGLVKQGYAEKVTKTEARTAKAAEQSGATPA
jgi:hypothetical protein